MKNWKNANRLECISGISAMLATWAAHVHLNSKCNRNDLAVVSEHTICGLLNRMYGWNLRNANTPKYPNFPSVDLVDEIAGVAVQVTADNSVKKVDHTLEKFREHKLNRIFSKLILVIITLDEPTETMKKREEGCFYGKRDIWNITYLTREIENVKSVEKLREIAEYLDEELGYIPQPGSTDSSGQNVENTTKSAGEEEKGNSANTETKTSENNQNDTEGAAQTSGKDPGTGENKTQETGKNTETTITKDTDSETIGGETGHTVEKESRLMDLIRKLKSRKPKQPKNKNRKKENAGTAHPKKWFWRLVPVILVAAVLLVFLIPEKELEAMPPELADYSVTINGQPISLPTTLGRLEEMGWVVKDAEKYMGIQVPAHSYYAYYGENNYWGGSAILTNGHGTIEVRLGNASNHTVPFEACIVYGITFYSSFDSSYTGESVNTLEGPLGLIWKQTSFRDVKWPKGFTKENSFGTAYSYRLSDHQQYEFGFDRNSKKLKSLKITNRDEAAMAAMLGDAYDTQPPEYDGDALAEWLGVRLVFTVFDLAHNYELPIGATVAAYQELGYAVEKQPEYVVSKEHENVYFRCDTLNQFHADVCNPFRRALTPENCFICVLDSRDMDTESTLFLEFSDGEKGAKLTVGTQESILRSDLLQQGILCQTDDGGQLIIYPNPDNRDITIKCWVSKDTGEITRIRVDICKALRDFMEQQAKQHYLEQKYEGIG